MFRSEIGNFIPDIWRRADYSLIGSNIHVEAVGNEQD
jgi:hypothetical protein